VEVGLLSLVIQTELTTNNLKNNPKHLLITKKPLAKPILLTSRLQLMTQIWNIRGGACWTVGKWRCSKL